MKKLLILCLVLTACNSDFTVKESVPQDEPEKSGPIFIEPESASMDESNSVSEPTLEPEPTPEPEPEPPSVSCTMKGSGRGSCKFTNTGSVPTSVCGKIYLYALCFEADCDNAIALKNQMKFILSKTENLTEAEKVEYFRELGVPTSSVFCSGTVMPRASLDVSFFVSDVNKLCVSPIASLNLELPGLNMDWGAICPFDFVVE